jgi:hypothetical protein
MRIASTRIGPLRASAEGIFGGKDAILDGQGRRLVEADTARDNLEVPAQSLGCARAGPSMMKLST